MKNCEICGTELDFSKDIICKKCGTLWLDEDETPQKTTLKAMITDKLQRKIQYLQAIINYLNKDLPLLYSQKMLIREIIDEIVEENDW